VAGLSTDTSRADARSVLARRGKALLRRLGKVSLAGDGLLERMRSTTFALLGITAAMALGLVAIAAQQVWPDLPFSPLPGPVAKHGEVHDALAVAQPDGAGVGSAQPAGRSGTAAAAPPSGGAVTDKGGSRLAESHQLESSGAGEEPAPDAPSGQDAAPSPGQSEPSPSGPPAAVPTPTPTPESSPAPPVSSPSRSEPVAVSATKDLDQGKDKARAYGKYKSSSGKGGKSEKDEKSSDAESKAPAPPPAPTVVEADEDVEEKEVEEDKDDSPTYRGKGRGHTYGHKGK
jgi:hypothetical protein